MLSKTQLTKALTDLNDGEPPAETDVDRILSNHAKIQQGSLSKPGFLYAIAMWYGDFGVALKRFKAHMAKEAKEAAFVKEALKCHISSNSGGLTYGEIKNVLNGLRNERNGSTEDVTEAEVCHRACMHFPRHVCVCVCVRVRACACVFVRVPACLRASLCALLRVCAQVKWVIQMATPCQQDFLGDWVAGQKKVRIPIQH